MSHSNHQSKMLEKDHEKFLEQMRQGHNNIMVVVRCRPLSNKEALKSTYETVKVLDERVAVLLDPGFELNPDDVLRKNRNKETQFAFDFVFDKGAMQEHIYNTSVQFLINGIFEGFNGTVFAYGATGAGKTYTMIGNPDQPGIMERAMNDVFRKNEQVQVTKEVSIKVSYIEIYNETIKDLLTTGSKHLELREDPSQGVVVSGITEIPVANTSEILHLLKVGNKNRTIESTGANEVSSRSHAVLQLQLQIKDKASGIQSEIQYSKLSLVDLAGSERASTTQNRGIRLIEGAKINQSLLVLGNCIQALSEATEKNIKNQFVQYRGSKLTRMLKDSLGGNCRTVMIANVSPHMASFEDTYNTLNFANRAKSIKTHVTRNYLSVDNHISNYTNLIDALKKENENLKRLLRNQSSPEAREKIALLREDEETYENSNNMDTVDVKEQQQPNNKRINNHQRLDRAMPSPTKNRQPSVYQTVDQHTNEPQSSQVNDQHHHYEARHSSKQKSSDPSQRSSHAFVGAGVGRSQQQHQNYTKESNSKDKSRMSQQGVSGSNSNSGNSSAAKERQINYLRNQLRLRDGIIKDQKSILEAQNNNAPSQQQQQQYYDDSSSCGNDMDQLGQASIGDPSHSQVTDFDYQYSSIIPSEPNLPTTTGIDSTAEVVRSFDKVKVRAKSKIEMVKQNNFSSNTPSVAPAAAAAGGSISDQEPNEPFRLPRIGFTSPTKHPLKVNNNYKHSQSHQSDSKGGVPYGLGGITTESGNKKRPENSGSRPLINQKQLHNIERSYSNKRMDTNENAPRTKSPSKRDLSENNHQQSPAASVSIDVERRRRQQQQRRNGTYSNNIVDSNRYQSHHYEGKQPLRAPAPPPPLSHPPAINTHSNEIEKSFRTSTSSMSSNKSHQNHKSNIQMIQRPVTKKQKEYFPNNNNLVGNTSSTHNNHQRIQMYLNKEITVNQQMQQLVLPINSDSDTSAFLSEKKEQPRIRTPRVSDSHHGHHNHHHHSHHSSSHSQQLQNYRSKESNSRNQMYQQQQSNDTSHEETPLWTPQTHNPKLRQNNTNDRHAERYIQQNYMNSHAQKQQQQSEDRSNSNNNKAQVLGSSPQYLNQIRSKHKEHEKPVWGANNNNNNHHHTRDHSEDRFHKVRPSQEEVRSSLNLREERESRNDRLKFLNLNLKNLKHQDIKVQSSIDTTTTSTNNYNSRSLFQQENLPLQLQQNHQKKEQAAVVESRDRINSLARRHYPQTSSASQSNYNSNLGIKRNVVADQRSERSISALLAPSSRLGLVQKI